MTRLARGLAAALAFVAVMLAARASWALPRFALRLGVPCVTCHVNPSGGGMRNNYGRYAFAPTKLPLAFPGSSALRIPLQTDIGDAVSVGADARSAYLDQSPRQGDGLHSFFQMQADLYVAAKPFNQLTLYYDLGAWGGSYEAMGIWQQPVTRNTSFYVKAGRFMPSYGLRLENHNLYVRQDIGFGPRDKDQGLEVGGQFGPVLIQLSALNGSAGERQLDENKSKAFVARAEAIGRLGAFRLMLGGSFYRNETGSLTDQGGTSIDARSKQTRFGFFGGAAIGRLTYLADMEFVHLDPYPGNRSDSKIRSYQTYQEFDVLLIRGLELTFNYEFRDPNLDLRSGVVHRVAFGFEVFPMPYLELKALYRRSIVSGPSGPEVAPLDGLSELIVMAHVFF